MKGIKLLALLLILPLASCVNRIQIEEVQNKEELPISFGTNVIVQDKIYLTRASGTSWDLEDKIGIFMHLGEDKNGSSSYRYENKCYKVTSTEGKLERNSKEDIMYFPKGAITNSSFTAYFPYSESSSTNNNLIDIDLNNDNKNFLLFAKTSGATKGKEISLQFHSVLSQLSFDVSELPNTTTAKIKSIKTKGKFNILTGEVVPAEGNDDVTEVNLVRQGNILSTPILPVSEKSQIIVEFTINNQAYEITRNLTPDLNKAGINCKSEIKFTGKEVIVKNVTSSIIKQGHTSDGRVILGDIKPLITLVEKHMVLCDEDFEGASYLGKNKGVPVRSFDKFKQAGIFEAPDNNVNVSNRGGNFRCVKIDWMDKGVTKLRINIKEEAKNITFSASWSVSNVNEKKNQKYAHERTIINTNKGRVEFPNVPLKWGWKHNLKITLPDGTKWIDIYAGTGWSDGFTIDSQCSYWLDNVKIEGDVTETIQNYPNS